MLYREKIKPSIWLLQYRLWRLKQRFTMPISSWQTDILSQKLSASSFVLLGILAAAAALFAPWSEKVRAISLASIIFAAAYSVACRTKPKVGGYEPDDYSTILHWRLHKLTSSLIFRLSTFLLVGGVAVLICHFVYKN
jgi:hypothetical protein